MRKTHWACLLLGLLLGTGIGVCLVILQLKYGHAPVAVPEAVAEANPESCLEEPKPLDEEPIDSATDMEAAPPETAPSTVLMPPVPVPVGPVEVTVVHRTKQGTEPADPTTAARCWSPFAEEPVSEAERLDQTQRRLLHHLLQHAQAVAEQPAVPAVLEEPMAPPTVTAAVPERLPAPRVEEAQTPVATAAVAPLPPAWSPVPPNGLPSGGLGGLPPAMMPPAVPPMPMPASLPGGPRFPGVPFTGTFCCTLDEHGELTVPAQAHEAMDCPRPRSLFIGPGPEKCLYVYPFARLQQLAQEYADFPDDAQARKDIRRCFSRIREVDVAADGRLKLPAELIQHAGLNRNLVLVGVRDHYELWDADHWQHYLEESAATAADRPAEPRGQAGEDETEIEQEDDDI